jgi:hypothetical protein
MSFLVTLLILLCCLQLYRVESTAQAIVFLYDDRLQIENGFVQLIFDRTLSAITVLSADFEGMGNFGRNSLSDPFRLEIEYPSREKCATNFSISDPFRPEISIQSNSSQIVEVIISKIADCPGRPNAVEEWTISLSQGSRMFDLHISGAVTQSADIVYISHTLYSYSSFVSGLFDAGVGQMMQNENACLASSLPLSRVYFVGNGVALDAEIVETSSNHSVMLFSKRSSRDDSLFSAGFQDIVFGRVPYESSEVKYGTGAWSSRCWADGTASLAQTGHSWNYTMRIGPNNADFPIYGIATSSDAEIALKMPSLDVQTFLTGAYSAAAGCLQSFYYDRDGTIAPTGAPHCQRILF